jgi:hypothetical protein
MLAGMAAAGGTLHVYPLGAGPVVQLCDDGGTPVVSIEMPILVRVPGEIERLLGPDVAERVPVPFWWVELRAPGTNPRGAAAARRFADALAARLAGVVWPPTRSGELR